MINGAVNETHPPKAAANAPVPASGKAAVALVYLFVIVYNMVSTRRFRDKDRTRAYLSPRAGGHFHGYF